MVGTIIPELLPHSESQGQCPTIVDMDQGDLPAVLLVNQVGAKRPRPGLAWACGAPESPSSSRGRVGSQRASQILQHGSSFQDSAWTAPGYAASI